MTQKIKKYTDEQLGKLTYQEQLTYCLDIIYEHEGHFSDDKRDPGGLTKWGISLRYLRMIGYDITGDGEIDEKDIYALDKKHADLIYICNWWEEYEYFRFNHVAVSAKVFDLAVNMGAKRAHKICQRAINKLRETPIAVDGILGEISYAAANELDPWKLREEMRKCAMDEYREILFRNRNMEWARKGWMRRAAW